ncbi:hypothetical protein [Candidatus Synchoanobacter obligatus]|uniref:Uncharacterized protein n=1 Tax=Candidatus Synchoanobacter obligatus TaxID=2919597 RepID=A0ABT1L4K8_9GAMM|nr:hypothetical protein [Candidatus Synchoanobacter obligatus]MCP8351891.1 hypothetical protein [Candidatus Synchoanobacter obligatus]
MRNKANYFNEIIHLQPQETSSDRDNCSYHASILGIINHVIGSSPSAQEKVLNGEYSFIDAFNRYNNTSIDTQTFVQWLKDNGDGQKASQEHIQATLSPILRRYVHELNNQQNFPLLGEGCKTYQIQSSKSISPITGLPRFDQNNPIYGAQFGKYVFSFGATVFSTPFVSKVREHAHASEYDLHVFHGKENNSPFYTVRMNNYHSMIRPSNTVKIQHSWEGVGHYEALGPLDHLCHTDIGELKTISDQVPSAFGKDPIYRYNKHSIDAFQQRMRAMPATKVIPDESIAAARPAQGALCDVSLFQPNQDNQLQLLTALIASLLERFPISTTPAEILAKRLLKEHPDFLKQNRGDLTDSILQLDAEDLSANNHVIKRINFTKIIQHISPLCIGVIAPVSIIPLILCTAVWLGISIYKDKNHFYIAEPQEPSLSYDQL